MPTANSGRYRQLYGVVRLVNAPSLPRCSGNSNAAFPSSVTQAKQGSAPSGRAVARMVRYQAAVA